MLKVDERTSIRQVIITLDFGECDWIKQIGPTNCMG